MASGEQRRRAPQLASSPTWPKNSTVRSPASPWPAPPLRTSTWSSSQQKEPRSDEPGADSRANDTGRRDHAPSNTDAPAERLAGGRGARRDRVADVLPRPADRRLHRRPAGDLARA